LMVTGLFLPQASPGPQTDARPDQLVDRDIAVTIVQLVREHLTDAAALEATMYALLLLENVDVPEVLDLQLEIVQKPSDQIPSSPRITGVQLAALALPGVVRHRNEPRVRAILDQILAGQLNPALRSQVVKNLAMVGEAQK
jgi:uncharacterized lipoprotein YmbA